MKRFLILALSVLAIALPLAAQDGSEGGFLAWGAYHMSDFDSINLQNNNLDLHIPLISYPQRGDLPDLSNYLYYRSFSWVIKSRVTSGGTYLYYASVSGSGVLGVAYDNVAKPVVYHDYSVTPHQYAYHVADSSGAQHILGWTSPTDMETVDGSGFHMVAGQQGGSVTDKNGVTYCYLSASSCFMKDSKGNAVTYSATVPNAWTDSVGRTIPQIPQYPFTPTSPGCTTYNFAGVYGGNSPLTFCYASYTLTTNFQNPPVKDASYTPTFLQSITLPNGRTWSFNYNSWGDLASITQPTGGTVSYSWTSGGGSVTRRMVTSRMVDANDGTGPKIWSYNSGSVTDPLGNDTVYTFGSGAKKIQYYNGSHLNAANLLKTDETQYAVDLPPNSAHIIIRHPNR